VQPIANDIRESLDVIDFGKTLPTQDVWGNLERRVAAPEAAAKTIASGDRRRDPSTKTDVHGMIVPRSRSAS
jgi:hypothetical protein